MTRLQTRLRDERGMTLVMVGHGHGRVPQRHDARGRRRHADGRAHRIAERGRRRRAGRRGGARVRRLRRPQRHRPGGTNAIAAATAADNGVMNAPGVGARRGRDVSGDRSGARARAAQQRTRQSALDVLRADVRHRHRRRRRRSDRRGLARQRHDVRQAVYRSRQVDRDADAAVGSDATPSTWSTTRTSRSPTLTFTFHWVSRDTPATTPRRIAAR